MQAFHSDWQFYQDAKTPNLESAATQAAIAHTKLSLLYLIKSFRVTTVTVKLISTSATWTTPNLTVLPFLQKTRE